MRSLWKGSLSFGLVNIPIRLYTASQEHELQFVMLHKKDHSRIHYARICNKENKEIPWKEIEKGYEFAKGDFVILTEQDFKNAQKEKSDLIEIESFTDESQIDSIYFEKPYFLEPEKGSVKAYHLLKEALAKSKKVGLATFVIHHRPHVGIIKAYGNLLVLIQLRYHSEIIPTKELQVAQGKASSQELNVAMKLIEHLTQPFKAEKYHDTYVQQLKKLIGNKKKGKNVVRQMPQKTTRPTKVHDIMSQLKASFKKAG